MQLFENVWRSALSPAPVPVLDEDVGKETPSFAHLKNAGLLLQLPATKHIICPGCGEHSEEVIPIRYPDGSMRFFVPCPESGREEVLSERLLQWGIHFAALPGFLGHAFSLPKARCCVQDKLWHLGLYGCDAGMGDLWLGRWLDWHENAVLFKNIPRSTQTILLYLGKQPDPSMLEGIPFENVIPVSNLMTIDAYGLSLDKRPIEAALARINANAVFSKDTYVFRLEGDVWRVAYEGKAIMRKDSLGMRYLQHLLAHPGEFFMASSLRKLTHPDFMESPPDSLMDEVTDGQSVRQYLQRLKDIPEALEKAQSNNELGKVAALHEEQQALLSRMQKDTRLGRRIRTFASEAQKLHQSLAKAVHRSLDGLQDKHFFLWRHLTNNIKIRNSFSYLPEEALRWQT